MQIDDHSDGTYAVLRFRHAARVCPTRLQATTGCCSTSTRSIAACCSSVEHGESPDAIFAAEMPPRSGLRLAGRTAAPSRSILSRRHVAHLDRLRSHSVPAVAAAARGAGAAGRLAGGPHRFRSRILRRAESRHRLHARAFHHADGGRPRRGRRRRRAASSRPSRYPSSLAALNNIYPAGERAALGRSPSCSACCTASASPACWPISACRGPLLTALVAFNLGRRARPARDRRAVPAARVCVALDASVRARRPGWRLARDRGDRYRVVHRASIRPARRVHTRRARLKRSSASEQYARATAMGGHGRMVGDPLWQMTTRCGLSSTRKADVPRFCRTAVSSQSERAFEPHQRHSEFPLTAQNPMPRDRNSGSPLLPSSATSTPPQPAAAAVAARPALQAIRLAVSRSGQARFSLCTFAHTCR